MKEEPSNSCHGTAMDGPRKMPLLRFESTARVSNQNPKKREATKPTDRPHFSDQFNVVVMKVVHDALVIQGFEFRIDRYQSASDPEPLTG